GWSLSAGQSSIARCRKTLAVDGVTDGVRFDDDDALCLDGRKLVLAGDLGKYQTEEWSDLAIQAGPPTGPDQAPSSFTVTSGDGVTMTYGERVRPHHAIVAEDGDYTAHDNYTVEWLLTRREDRLGNAEE